MKNHFHLLIKTKFELKQRDLRSKRRLPLKSLIPYIQNALQIRGIFRL